MTVTAPDGRVLPVPSTFQFGSTQLQVNPSARVVAECSGNRHYFVRITNPSLSGDARMTLAAAGVGSANAATTQMVGRTAGLERTFLSAGWFAGRAIVRGFTTLLGIIYPNNMGGQWFFDTRLPDGVQVRYLLIA